MTEAFQNCLKRFPVTVCFIFALTAYFIYLVAKDVDRSQCALTWEYYLSVGTLLSLTLHLWCEEMKRTLHKVLTQVIGHALLIIDALFLYYTSFETSYSEIIIAHIAGVFAIGLSVFVLSFLREKNDIAGWNFTVQSLSALASAYFIGWIMWGGISLLLLSLSKLFGIHIKGDYYIYVTILTNVWLPLMLFIGLLPQGEDKHNREAMPKGFLNGILHYLFLPLTASYLIVLYVYALRILITWTLPNGWVSWLVVAIMALCLLIEFGLYPSRISEQKKWDVRIVRWIPILILPLLLLMTVGIVRRFCDYGVTINRLYLITLNGWFYLVCLGLFLNKGKRIHWIPISFAFLFLLTSILPVNYASYTRQKIYSQIETQVKATCKEKLPMDDEAYIDWLKQLPKKQARQLSSRLSYMEVWFGADSYKAILQKEVNTHPYYFYDEDWEADTVEVEPIQADSTFMELHHTCNDAVSIPQGYSKVYAITSRENTYSENTFHPDSIPFRIAVTNAGISDTIYFDTKVIKKASGAQPLEVKCQSEKHKFFLTGFHLTRPVGKYQDITLTVSGLLFKK